jgi:hypothetical protein
MPLPSFAKKVVVLRAISFKINVDEPTDIGRSLSFFLQVLECGEVPAYRMEYSIENYSHLFFRGNE